MIGALIAKSKVTSSYDLLNARDIKKFLANWHDECVWCYPGAVSVSGEFKGKTAVEEWFQNFLDHFQSIKLTPKSVCVNNMFDFVGSNIVTVNFDEELIDNDGNKFLFEGVTVITLKFGKATHAQDFFLSTDEEMRKAWGD